jgi:hypothetical protein
MVYTDSMTSRRTSGRLRVAKTALACGVAGALAAASSGATATEATQCYDAHEAAQIQRKDGQWLKARAFLAACGNNQCPPIVQRDCVAWAAELAAQQPSVVVAVVRDDGTDVLGPRVLVDGATVPSDGRATEVDPGEHRVRVEVPGKRAIDEDFVIREGERGRRLVVKLPSDKPRPSSSPPTATWILGGVAVAALGSFATFAAIGKARENDLAETCNGQCSDDEVASARRFYIIADVSLGAAVIAAGAAVVVWVVAPKRKTPSAGGHPSPGRVGPLALKPGDRGHGFVLPVAF